MNINLDNIYLNEKYESRILKLTNGEIDDSMKNGKLGDNGKQIAQKMKEELNNKIKELSSNQDQSKLKDPNFLVKVIRWFRGLYLKAMSQRSGKYPEKDGFFNKIIGRILRFVDRLMSKLQKLVDRRTFEQISDVEKFDELVSGSIANNSEFYKSDMDTFFKKGHSKYEFSDKSKNTVKSINLL